MKGKILKMLKTKYAQRGLSKETLEAMASTLEKQLTEDSTDDEIEAVVNGVDNLLKSFQSDSDKRVTDAVNKAKGTQNQGQDDPAEPKPEPQKQGDQSNDIAKAIQAAIAPLVEQIASMKGEKVTTDRRQLLEKALENADQKTRDKALRDFDRMKFEKDGDFESFLEETETFVGEAGSVETPKVGGGFGRPPKSGGKSASEASVVADIKSWAASHGGGESK